MNNNNEEILKVEYIKDKIQDMILDLINMCEKESKVGYELNELYGKISHINLWDNE